MVITTSQLRSAKSNLKFCAGSTTACNMSEICNGENLWQWCQLEIRLHAFHWSTNPQKQFINTKRIKKTDYRLRMGKCILVKSIKSVTLKLRYSCDCMWTISARQTNWNGELKMDPLLEDRVTKSKPFSQQLQIWSNTVKQIVGNRQLIVWVSLIIVWG